MTTKSILFAVAVAALVGAAIASCPNACSGHGSCGNHDRCTCYANYIGGDCSEKACPYGHNGKECSARGICDRGAGSCECQEGYSGASCHRISCPNDCSGKGSCDTTTGMCNCAGGYAGNDCSSRLCPKGDDPLTHEVENSGDGSASQQSEVQVVTFNAGRGLGGKATLTYHDLYGQSWTTRPFNVGGDNVYRLEVSIKLLETVTANEGQLTFTYGAETKVVQISSAAASSSHGVSNYMSAAALRAALLPLFGPYLALPFVGKDRGSTIYVTKHHSATSVKLAGAVVDAARVTYDIHIPVDMSGHDDNGGLHAFSAAWTNAVSGLTENKREVKLYQVGDRSAEIEHALKSLPNQIIPSVTVSKSGVTDSDTNSDGAAGNTYAQSYAITFNHEANSGDQNMLSCNAEPCDEDGCINRRTGAAEVRYMHHDPETRGEGINFVNQGYFIMDIGKNTAYDSLSAGTIRIMWDTGAGISSAEFAVVATAAEVQTALRTIPGWEGVTVELWGSVLAGGSGEAASLLYNHQFKVTFAAGYDDLGKSPTFKTLGPADGAYATATNSPTAKLYDQRFSNSIWLGKVTGYVIFHTTAATTGLTKHVVFDSTVDITGNTNTDGGIDTLPVNGDTWVTSNTYFGTGGKAITLTPGTDAGGEVVIHNNAAQSQTLAHATAVGGVSAGKNFAYLKESAISVQTSDYFAVGSTIEVLGTTWDDASVNTDVDVAVGAADTADSALNPSNNKYRKFKVTGHVTNPFNREFAKLDSFPADDGVSPLTPNEDKPDYLLKITSNNATVHTYPSVTAQVTVNEIQVVVIGTGATGQTATFKLYYGTEETADMNEASTEAQVAEEINGFSHLSGPVSVAKEGVNYLVTFDAKDGDVAQMTAVTSSGNTVAITTRANGWSIEGPVGLGLDTMQAGGTINITTSETCSFQIGTLAAGYFCYDGLCGPVAASTSEANMQAAVRGIKDSNGDSVAGLATVTIDVNTVIVTMPLGKSCDGLEMRVASQEVTKTVAKGNNGRLFKIKRSFLQQTIADVTASANKVDCAAAAQTATAGCHQVLQLVDSVLIQDKSSCAVSVAANDGAAYPISRVVSSVVTSAGAHQINFLTAIDVSNDPSNEVHDTNCIYRLARHVITLDAMPTASATTVQKSLEYRSPVGSCSVSETTKGTYESSECSNRGACDTKSGLCSCYEGYSGQSCQTQTVLV